MKGKKHADDPAGLVANAEYAVRGFIWAATRFASAYDRRYWETFGASCAEVVQCATEEQRADLLRAARQLASLVETLEEDAGGLDR